MEEIFKFEKYSFNSASGTAVFEYAIGKLKFKERLIFPNIAADFKKANKNALDKALFNLFLIAGISYYKTYAPKVIDLGKFKLTKEQAGFWNKTYTKGLGEFFYVNKIDYRGLVNFPYDREHKVRPMKIKTGNKTLVPFGGGKDSIVTLENLKERGVKFDLFSLRDFQVSRKVAQVAGKNLLVVKRKISPNLFKLNKKNGVYNGHIPFSAYTAFLSIFACAMYGYKSVVFSNEKSSNYGNIKYLDKEINHQWSKSYEFEKMFGDYLKKFITPSVKYYNILRQFNELQIVGKFVKYKKYLPVFSSCNRANFKLSGATGERWCWECPKCVFTWTMLSAYLPHEELVKIFGKDITKNKEYKKYLAELLGKKNHKPFECVGTPEEVKLALALANKYKYLILGFGREGLSTYKYLRKKYPSMVFGVADKNDFNDFSGAQTRVLRQDKKLELYLGKDYLKSLNKFQLIVKTPGIKLKSKIKSWLAQNFTSNLELFLSQVKGRVIGVTGSKGKSTSASLIYHILKKAGKKVVLAGNIGKPVLDYLSFDSSETIFVVEMSSYQLEILALKKIDAALITSFFPEHLDYHGSLNKYFQAKMNIARNLKDDGTVVYNKKYKKIERFIKSKKIKRVEYVAGAIRESPLQGRHNLENIAGAVEVAKLFGVSGKMAEALVASFKGLEHRLEYVGKYREIVFYNDVLSTTPESTIEAIEALIDKKLETIIVGGFDRGLDYSQLVRRILLAKIKNVILWPHTGDKISREIQKTGKHKSIKSNLIKVKNMQEAVRACYKYTAKGGVALLSPAASSYDYYKNYAEKGAEFKRFIREIAR